MKIRAERHQFCWLFISLIGVFFINLIPNLGDLQSKSLICLTLQGIAGFNVVLRRNRAFVTVPIVLNVIIFLFFPDSLPFIVLGKMLYLYFLRWSRLSSSARLSAPPPPTSKWYLPPSAAFC
ncbi:hypothetical protein O0544_23050 [Edwardsiella anguillarum]|nr:hypothetical protein [Edwardsiella anguillarum]